MESYLAAEQTYKATIANGQTTSGAITLKRGERPVGLLMPAAFTGTACTFTVSLDGTTYVTAYAVGGASTYSVTVGTSRYVPLNNEVFRGVRDFKIVSGSSEGGSRDIVVVCRELA